LFHDRFTLKPYPRLNIREKMHYPPSVKSALFWLLAAILPAFQQPDHCAVVVGGAPSLPAKLMDGMGQSDFQITTSSPEAQAFFNQGISQLYAFWSVEAERSFMQAAALDPEAGMAYWGIAISAAGDFLPAYQTVPNTPVPLVPVPGSAYSRAGDAIMKARELKPKLTERERLYIDAIAARDNPRARRPDDDYITAMRKIVSAFPDDSNAKAILALALDRGFDSSTRKPRPGTEESIGLLNSILAEHPKHVGALHFLIHALEDSGHGQDAWPAAEKYPLLVPAIPHVLHMPGHVYVQTGRFEDAIHSFENAGAKERAYMEADPLYPHGHYLHNQQFLIYALDAAGRFRAAVEESRKLMSVPENPDETSAPDFFSSYRIGWFSLMRTLVRFEKWDLILDGKTLPAYNKPREQVWYHWAQGIADSARGNRDDARESLRKMEIALGQFKTIVDPVPRQFYVARMELEAVIDNDAAALQQAASEQQDMLYSEPPVYPRPVLENLGRLFLGARLFGDAEIAYRKLLDREPGSGRALLGLYRALAGLGRDSEAAAVLQDFQKAWATADPELRDITRQN